MGWGRKSFFWIALLFLVVFTARWSAFADETQDPTAQYLALRRINPPRRGLTLAQLNDSPNGYNGVTLELRGQLNGVIRVGNGASLIFTTDQLEPLMLHMSEIPTWVQAKERLCVLAVVAPTGGAGRVVAGTPDLQVVAVASASDVAAAEARYQEQADRRAAELRQREAQAESAAVKANGASVGRRTWKVLGAKASGAEDTVPQYEAIAARSNPQHVHGALSKYLSPAAQQAYPAYVDFVRRWNHRLTDTQADAIAASILNYSERYQVDPRLVVSLIIAESDFHLGETSNKGAMGLGQLMPDEVQSLGLSNPYDPVQNIAGAVYLLRGRLDKYSGGRDVTMQHIILALASYNAGMGAVKKYGGVPPYRETQNYVRKIERIYRQLCAGGAPQ